MYVAELVANTGWPRSYIQWHLPYALGLQMQAYYAINSGRPRRWKGGGIDIAAELERAKR